VCVCESFSSSDMSVGYLQVTSVSIATAGVEAMSIWAEGTQGEGGKAANWWERSASEREGGVGGGSVGFEPHR
jgi:hypothetical protein